MRRDILDSLLQAKREKRAAALVTELESGRQLLIAGDDSLGDLPSDPDIAREAALRIAENRSGVSEDGELFFEVFNPPLRLIVVGAVHIAQSLVPMAVLGGYETVVVDPRRAWATDVRFPNVTLIDAWPDEGLRELGLDHRTAVVTLTHDPKLDDPALLEAIRSPAFYIGALGSTRTHAKRLDRLAAEGATESELARIHGPAGLAIGARSPAEIAISILAQMTGMLHHAPRLVKTPEAAA